MKNIAKQNQIYSHEWFEKRALNAIKPLGDNVWDYSDSLLLYLPGAEESYEEIQKDENPYNKLVTEPEREYLHSIASDIVAELPAYFRYIDLGPGTEHKEQFVFDAARRQQKEFTYAPVDISEKFLKLSTEYAEQQGITTHPVRLPFEDLIQKIDRASVPNFVSIGLTYSNYDPVTILELLKCLADKNGFAFINAQIRDRVDMKELESVYNNDAQGMVIPKLTLLGLDIDRDVESITTDNGIRFWCTLRRSTPQLEQMGITQGARLMVFQSLRPTREEFEKDIAKVYESYSLFDTGASFVGALLKN